MASGTLASANFTLTSSTTISQQAWSYWNTGYSSTTYTVSSTSSTTTWPYWNAQYELTAEQAEAVSRQQEQQRELARQMTERRQRAELERQVARVRAEELLLSVLTERQASTYRQHGWFEVRGSKGGRWRIRNRGQSGNVDLMPEIGDERLASYCAHPPDGLPDADAHLAQMLQLTADEDTFKRIANIHYQRPGRQAA